MCGIVGYVGKLESALPVLIEGLKRLEYRGYDSAGIALVGPGHLETRKAAGRISVLEDLLTADPPSLRTSSVGVAHTRWATHGAPNSTNAHPHIDGPGRIAVVHNGIIENHASLRRFLTDQGAVFRSETDTEVLAHLINFHLTGGRVGNGVGPASASRSMSLSPSASAENGGRKLTLLQAVLAALHEVDGTFGLAVLSADHPDTIVVARRGSPLLIGVGNDEYIVASDAAAIVGHTANVIYLSDNEAAELTTTGLRTVTLDAVPVSKTVEQVELALEQIELGGHEHYMLKEICEQSESLSNCMRGRIDAHNRRIVFGGLEHVTRDLLRTRRFLISACGTAWHAGLIGEYLMEDLARINTEVEYASELRYRNPIIEENTTAIFISQSGETADTLAALREVKDKGALALGVINVVGSTIARETDAGVYLHVGPEIGVASTKAFVGQVLVLTMLAMWMGRKRHLSEQRHEELLQGLGRLPGQIEALAQQSDSIRKVAERYVDRENWLYLGRGYHYPIALEAALKLKEISYIHAEGLPAAEMKHGPIALITDGMPVVVIAPRGSQYEKVVSNIQEVKARGGRVIAVGTEGDANLASLADVVFEIPDAPEPLQPLLSIIPLQLLAYHAAVIRGCNVDRPRNLAKSVTVE